MPKLGRVFQLQTHTGETTTRGGIALTPQSQAITVELPFFHFVWNRPVAVIVDRAGQIERVPIVDVTRLATWGLLGVSLVFSVIITMAVRRKEPHHE
jgi:hypothetical protein